MQASQKVKNKPKGSSQKKYFETDKGRAALKRARKAYDERDPDRRRKQKRDYMRRKRKGLV